MIGADALSRWVDWDDRNSCILFGDGAGAMVLEAAQDASSAGLLGERVDTILANRTRKRFASWELFPRPAPLFMILIGSVALGRCEWPQSADRAG